MHRSTPCPNAKHGEEWGDPTGCDNGDNCQYCHTRTEQQFHPEIYKSTKCHDMQTNSYCPRGSFCAFAHGDFEVVRDNGHPYQVLLFNVIRKMEWNWSRFLWKRRLVPIWQTSYRMRFHYQTVLVTARMNQVTTVSAIAPMDHPTVHLLELV